MPPLLRADQAEQRYNEAVQAAVEKCAADGGQTCFICMDGAAAEGLCAGVRAEGVRVRARVVSSAAGEDSGGGAVENNLDIKVKHARWGRWHQCGLCEQGYHGVAVRARMGVLEDVRGAAGNGLGSNPR